MRIKTRLLITAILPLLIGLTVGGVNLFESRSSAEFNNDRENIQRVSQAVFELTLIDSEYHTGEIQERVILQWRQRHQSLRVLLQNTQPRLNAKEKESLESLRHAHESIGFLFGKINELIKSEPGGLGQVPGNLLILLSGQQRAKLHEMLAHADRIQESLTLRNQKEQEAIHLSVYAVIILLTSFSFALAYVINNHIARAILSLQQGAEIIGSGNLNHRINLHSPDEFGQLSHALDQMSQRLQDSHAQLEGRLNELKAANWELETFSYAAAHNFRTPMRAISGFSSLLWGEYRDRLDETGRHYLQEIQGGCLEMERIIKAFLKLTQATIAVIKRQPVDLSQLATAILEGHRALEPDRSVTWQVTPDLIAQGDPSLLRTVLENLLDNAWKFTNTTPNAHISFSAKNRQGETVYQVHDNGAGFDMAYKNKLFQPFQRLHKVTEFPGVSLGLAITQRVIARHGGRIWAEGQPGRGAAFFFTLATRETF